MIQVSRTTIINNGYGTMVRSTTINNNFGGYRSAFPSHHNIFTPQGGTGFYHGRFDYGGYGFSRGRFNNGGYPSNTNVFISRGHRHKCKRGNGSHLYPPPPPPPPAPKQESLASKIVKTVLDPLGIFHNGGLFGLFR